LPISIIFPFRAVSFNVCYLTAIFYILHFSSLLTWTFCFLLIYLSRHLLLKKNLFSKCTIKYVISANRVSVPDVFDEANTFGFVSGSVEATLLFCRVGEKEKIFKAFFKKLFSSLQKTVALLTFLRKLLEELNKIRTLIIRTMPFVNVNVIFSHLLHTAL